jgi:hypothetical protein
MADDTAASDLLDELASSEEPAEETKPATAEAEAEAEADAKAKDDSEQGETTGAEAEEEEAKPDETPAETAKTAAEAPAEPAPAATHPIPQPEHKPDEIEAELAQSIADIDADEILTDSQKRAQKAVIKANLETYRRSAKAEKIAIEQQEQQKAQAFWADKARATGVPEADLQRMWNAEIAAYTKKYPHYKPESWQLAATESFETKVAALKTTPKPATTATTTPAPATTGKAKTGFSPKAGTVRNTKEPEDEGVKFDREWGSAIAGMIE